MRRILAATAIAIVTLLVATVAAFAQGADIPVVTDPNVAQLASAAGLAAVVALVTNILRTTVPDDVFRRWGATIAVVVGMALGVVGLLATNGPLNVGTVTQALLVGLFGGWMSQNVNTQVKTAVRGA